MTIIVGILAAAVVQVVDDSGEETRIASARGTVRAINNVIALKHAETGRWPSEIDPTWFDGSVLPANTAVNSSQAIKVHMASEGQPTKFDPSYKSFQGTIINRSGYWYNSENGAFRARVDEDLFDDPVAAYDAINR